MVVIPFLYPVHEAPYDFYRYTKYGIENQLKKNNFVIERSMPWGGIGMLLCVYFHMFFGKMIKNKWINNLSCFLQKITYCILKKCCYRKWIKGVGKTSQIITLGNFVIARKK